ncbi:hypothetical protein KRZ98_09895 [Sphingobium sp. AS12]|uniref:carph-isopro domain-containing protein n=1 Tax=Sphingobium sp. AS12 TaxID=2849495 RepID=UPI001C314AA6|nr:hypothetical protein [Sphingobium sp. AS12]MBV2148596.1 hypothetical protein [Sphingobium sp. AS12]
MIEQTSFDAIYRPWSGNAAAMARDIAERSVTVSQWRYRGSIPPRYWQKIIAAAAVRGFALTVDDFVEHVVHASADTASATPASSDTSVQNVGQAL